MAQTGSKTQTINYHGIHPDDPDRRFGLRNPESGFRHEAYIGHPSGYNIWGDGSYLADSKFGVTILGAIKVAGKEL